MRLDARASIAAAVVVGCGLTFACGVPTQTKWADDSGSPLITGPYLLLGDTGVAYVAMRSRGGAPVVEWRLVEPEARADPTQPTASKADDGAAPSGASGQVTAKKREDMWVATLSGLPEHGVLTYRVVSPGGTTSWNRFRVGSPPGRTVRFAVFGDTRTRHSVHRAVIEAVSRESLDFLVHTGDMVERGGIRSQWDTFFQIERPLLEKVPILPSIGNHDIGARAYYRRYFLHDLWARGRRYYKKDWGNLRLIAMDGGIECRDGCEQYSYVREALEEAVERDMLVVMFLHFPPYSSGSHGSHKGVQRPITDLAKRYGVELVIAGHDHNYERTKPIHGTTYVVSGSAGAPIKAVYPKWFSAHARTEPHYVLIDVDAGRMTLRAINLNGETFDSHVITPVPPSR